MGRCFGKKIQVATKIHPFLTNPCLTCERVTHTCAISQTQFKNFALKDYYLFPLEKKNDPFSSVVLPT